MLPQSVDAAARPVGLRDSPRIVRARLQGARKAFFVRDVVCRKVVTQLDEGCEVWVVESRELESGRERCRLERPVIGWVSAMFLTSEEKRQPGWTDGPLAESVIGMIGRREGNGTCFECGVGIPGLFSADGESAWADCGRGVVLCFECARKRDALHLRLDAFGRHHTRAMLMGGNGQLRDFARKRHDKASLEEYKATLAAEAGTPSPTQFPAAALAGADEARATVVGKFYMVETHGGRAAIRDTDDPALRVGDYVVGVDRERVWNFPDVVAALETRNYEVPLCLLVKRVDVLEHPLYLKTRPAIPCSHGEDEAIPEEVEIAASGGPASYAGHATVMGYWQEEEEIVRNDEPLLVPRKLAVLPLGRGAPLGFRVKRRDVGPFAAATLHDDNQQHFHRAIVVGVNERRRHFQYDDFLDALNMLRRPLLILLALD